MQQNDLKQKLEQNKRRLQQI
jgi:chromosome segregation ATPase